jgi:hypothetical protein
MTIKEELEQIFLSDDRKGWTKKKSYTDLSNLDAGVIYIKPDTALSIDEVEKFTVLEDVTATIKTTFINKEKRMRDPARIERILKLVEKIWNDTPDLRLTQIIMNALKMNSDPYYVEDDKLEDALKSVCKEKGI